jgi:diguanylate cyclase (GGDEF)-like protein
MASENLNDKLRYLQRQYTDELPERLKHITLVWNSVCAGSGTGGIKVLYRLLHSLAGSGATFGYAELSVTSATISELLHKNEASNGNIAPDAFAIIEALIAQLAQDAKQFREPESPLPDRPRRHESVQLEMGPANARTVFLFEDDALLAAELAQQIRHFGYNVQVYADPIELKQAIARTRPSAILMDIVFEQGSLAGPSAVRAVGAEIIADVPVLFISMRTDLPARLEAVRAGAKGYFTKPLDVSIVVEQLDRLTGDGSRDPLRVLIVDDTRIHALLTATMLGQAGMQTRVVTDPSKFLENLSDFQPELILLDMYMPDCTGEELAAVVRQHDEYVSIPIIYLSGETDRERQLQAMRFGGEEFLSKPIRTAHLVAAVEIRAERYRVLRSFMERDSLTGLLNHTRIKAELEKELTRARRLSVSLCFVMIDIDKFKFVNDTYGHPAGDRVIRAVARILKQRLRKTDVLGRYGGEEFAVVLTDTDPATAVRVIDEVREAFAQVTHLAENVEFSVSFSAGIACFPALKSATELGDAADRALYAAKRAGSNRVLLSENLVA